MPRKVLIPVVAIGGLVLLGAVGAYAYFFSGLRTSPSALALASPTASRSTSATAGTTTAPGTWEIASGSLAGYRVKEQFAGQASTHEAVARTGDVSGTVTINQSGGTYTMASAQLTVQLTNLASVDSVAGYNVTNRDRLVQRALDVSSFPTAVFIAQNVTLPAGVETGQTVNISVPGQLTIRGVTKPVTATLQLRVSGSSAQIAGTIPTNMSDFGITPPSAPFTVVQTGVTIEVALNLSQAA